MVPNAQAQLVSRTEVDEFGHALGTWSDTTTQYWVSVGRKSQIPLSGKFATFRV